MLIRCSKGMYRLLNNYRDAFKIEEFQEKYLEECFDKYPYIVGDISSNILRLKGFDENPKSPSFYKNIDKYIEDSCAFGCPYFILSRIHSEDEYRKLEANDQAPITEDARFVIPNIQKENYDKESLILKPTPKTKTNIVINIDKLNSIPKGELPPDLVELIKAEKQLNNNQRKRQDAPIREKEPEQTFVSASPDFDPSKKEKKGKFYNNRRNKNK